MKFLKIFFATLLACIVSSVVGMILWIAVLVSMVGGTVKSTVIEPGSVLKIDFSQVVSDAPSIDPFSQIDFQTMQVRPTFTLLGVLTALETAAQDDNIKGVYLNISETSTLWTASAGEIRAALEQFKASGKFVISYNDVYTQGGYYLSSVADKLYVQPEGVITWQGMATNTMFYKGLFDKLDISVDVFRPTACRYKSAVEPYILNKMSAENRSQMQQLLSSMWGVISQQVATSRGLSLAQVNRIADKLLCYNVEKALEVGMVDGLIYEDQVGEKICELCDEIQSEKEIKYVDFADYYALHSKPLATYGADKVGIIYAQGAIYDGKGYDENIYGDDLAATIASAREDKSVKAVVLRVNSPGGSALASDVIWRELELLRAEKPLIVSMGAYAASGGYYISAPADAILASPITLTGSIGVFGMMFDVEGGLKSKLGITFDGVKTNTSAGFMSSTSPLSAAQKRVMLQRVDNIYERFTSLVSSGRNMPLPTVMEIAQGRVWSGVDAMELGLVDAMGGLREAVAVAVDKAGIEAQYRVEEITPEPVGFAAIFSSLEAGVRSAVVQRVEPFAAQKSAVVEVLEMLDTPHGLMMYMPYSVEL